MTLSITLAVTSNLVSDVMTFFSSIQFGSILVENINESNAHFDPLNRCKAPSAKNVDKNVDTFEIH